MDIYISSLQEFLSEIIKNIELLKLVNYSSTDSIKKQLTDHLSRLKPDSYLLIETSYTDKVFRDSYYKYYSTKLSNYERNCIKLSIFSKEINTEDFRNITEDKRKYLQNIYMGFIIIRPTPPHIIGRNVLSPEAITTKNKILICFAEIPITANSIKLKASGFPHSSQDSEVMSCAETSIWALMEYFSHKYAGYRPILPSEIISAINDISHERLLPSTGLDIVRISYALRKFGFEPKIYSKEVYGSRWFENLLSCYIESGIPLILAIEWKQLKSGHAIICCGHEEVQETLIDSTNRLSYSEEKLESAFQEKKIIIRDSDDINKKFVFVDDNLPVYQSQYLSSPTQHYELKELNSAKITHFIAPLYSRIYIEAYQAKSFILTLIGKSSFFDSLSNKEIFLRVFLASSRSYKDYLLTNNSLNSKLPRPKDVALMRL